jgi:hypothetical protein
MMTDGTCLRDLRISYPQIHTTSDLRVRDLRDLRALFTETEVTR